MKIAKLFLLLAALATPLCGQEAKISVRTLAITPGKYPTVWAAGPAAAVKLEFPDIQPSDAYQLTSGKTLALYQGELDEKGKPKDTAPSQVKLPEEGGSNVLLLAWLQDGKIKFLPLPDAAVTGKRNEWRVVNMTHKSVGIQLGDKTQPVVFPAISSKPLQIDNALGKTASIVMAGNDNGTWNKFYSTYWELPADKRCLILMVQLGEKIEVRQIFEEIDRNPDKGKAGKEDKSDKQP